MITVQVVRGGAGWRPPGIAYDAAGRPTARDGAVSVADAGEWVLVARAPLGRRVGIDIERVRPRRNLEALARRTMTDAEFADWAAQGAQARLVAFHEHWVMVEAVLKARGTGLAGGLRWRPPPGWSVVSVPVPEGYAAALAIDAGPVRIEQTGPGSQPSRRAGAGAGGTLGALMVGLGNVIEPSKRREEPAIVTDWGGDPDDPADLLIRLDPDNPADSIVWVRRARAAPRNETGREEGGEVGEGDEGP